MTYRFRTALSVFILSTLMMLATGHLLTVDPLRSPFGDYEHLMPGQMLLSYNGWRCETDYGSYFSMPQSYFYCSQPGEDAIHWVSISGQDARIIRTGFHLNLRYGDLVALFGASSSVRRVGRLIAIVNWQGISAYVLTRHRGLWMDAKVIYVAFYVEEES